MGGVVETQIGELEGNDFADSGAGIVQQQEQSPVSDSGARVDINGRKNGLHFFLFEVVDSLVRGALERDRTDLLARKHQDGLLAGDESEQGADGRQAGVACSWRATSTLLHLIQKAPARAPR